MHFRKTIVHIQNVLFENGLVIFGKRVCIFKVQKGLSENPEGDIQRIQKANSQNKVGEYSKTEMGNIRRSQLTIFKNRNGQCSKFEMVIIRKSKWAIFEKQEGQYLKIEKANIRKSTRRWICFGCRFGNQDRRGESQINRRILCFFCRKCWFFLRRARRRELSK